MNKFNTLLSQIVESFQIESIPKQISKLAEKAGFNVVELEVHWDYLEKDGKLMYGDAYSFTLVFESGFAPNITLNESGDVHLQDFKIDKFFMGNVKNPERIVDNFKKFGGEQDYDRTLKWKGE